MLRLDLEAEARGVAGEAQQAGGVVEEAALVQDAQPRLREVLERMLARRSGSPARLPREGQRDRVDGEVPAAQVLLDVPARTSGSAPGDG